MSSPVKPNDFKALIPSGNDGACSALKKLIQLPAVIYRAWNWMFDSAGNLTSEFKTLIGTVASSGTTPTTAPNAPANLAASSGLQGFIRLTWETAAGAASYLVYRSTSADMSSPTLITTVSTVTHDDTTAVAGTLYYYYVKASNSIGTSPASNTVSGSAVAAAPTHVEKSVAGTSNVTIPATATTMTVKVWGGGGGGGGGTPWVPVPNPPIFGGGGGSGAYAIAETIDVTEFQGDTVQVTVGGGGSAGSTGQGGANGNTSMVILDGEIQAQAYGGSGGVWNGAGGAGGSYFSPGGQNGNAGGTASGGSAPGGTAPGTKTGNAGNGGASAQAGLPGLVIIDFTVP